MMRRFGPPRGVPCTPATHRCEFWTWGPDYVRPDCCSSLLTGLAEFTHELLDRHGIRHWLDYGSLLGAVRDGRLIPWDSDVDMGILAEDLDAVLALVGELESAGHVMDNSDPQVLRINVSDANTQHVDIYAWKRHEGMLTLTYDHEGADWIGMHEQGAFPASYVDQFETVALEGQDYPAPLPVGEFLEKHRYGAAYMTPVRPPVGLTRYPSIRPEDLSPELLRLYQLVARTEAELLMLERRRVGRLGTLHAWERWCSSGLPEGPAPDRLERLRQEWPGAQDEAGMALLSSLAVLEQGVFELSHPTVKVLLDRGARRLRKLARRIRRRMPQPG